MVTYSMGYNAERKKHFVRSWTTFYNFYGLEQIPGRAVYFDTVEEASEYMNIKTRELYAQDKESEDINE